MRLFLANGLALLLVVSGILTILSYLPLFYLSPGLLRDQNFTPVSGQMLAIFVLPALIEGALLVSMGVAMQIIPKLNLIWSAIALLLAIFILRSSLAGSTTLALIPGLLAVSAGLIGVAWKIGELRMLTASHQVRFVLVPVALAVVGLWEFFSAFLSCVPPIGIGQDHCELLGPLFYVVVTFLAAGVFTIIGLVMSWIGGQSLMRSPGKTGS